MKVKTLPKIKPSSKTELIAAIEEMVPRWQDETQRFDDAVGRKFALSAAERLCLGLVAGGPQTASAIARETGLSPAAITALLDRLETRKLVRRQADADDRRKVKVTLSDKARPVLALYLPIRKEGRRLLAGMTAAELAAVAKFVSAALDMQRRFTRGLSGEPRTTPSPRRMR